MKKKVIFPILTILCWMAVYLMLCSKDEKGYTIVSEFRGPTNEIGRRAVVTSLTADSAMLTDLKTLAAHLQKINLPNNSNQFYVFSEKAPDLTNQNFGNVIDAANFCKKNGAIAEIYFIGDEFVHGCRIKNGEVAFDDSCL